MAGNGDLEVALPDMGLAAFFFGDGDGSMVLSRLYNVCIN